MRLPAFFLAVVLAAPLLVACGRTVSGARDDATISTRVNIALLSEKTVDVTRIQVKTFDGVVTLSGVVKSKQEEEKAIALARTIRGVKDVRSNLRIDF